MGYSAGASALLYLWGKDERNFNAAMSKYYTFARSRTGKIQWLQDSRGCFENGTEYYTLSEFVTINTGLDLILNLIFGTMPKLQKRNNPCGCYSYNRE